MSDRVLAIRGLTRTYRSGDRDLTVLSGADLDVAPGEIVGLIGPSGSGKSSLLHAAGLLEHPTAGQILIEERDCSKLSDRQRTRVRLSTIGFVYQAHHLLPEFTALDNVALPQMIAGQSRKLARARADELLTQLGLGERLHHQPAQMSGGEQQRVAIARALANRPRLLLGRRADRQSRPGHLGGGVRPTLCARPQRGRRRPGRHPQSRTGPPHGPRPGAQGRQAGDPAVRAGMTTPPVGGTGGAS